MFLRSKLSLVEVQLRYYDSVHLLKLIVLPSVFAVRVISDKFSLTTHFLAAMWQGWQFLHFDPRILIKSAIVSWKIHIHIVIRSLKQFAPPTFKLGEDYFLVKITQMDGFLFNSTLWVRLAFPHPSFVLYVCHFSDVVRIQPQVNIFLKSLAPHEGSLS